VTSTETRTTTPAILGPIWDADTPAPDGYVKFVIDGRHVIAPKGEVVIRTCERMGIEITRFCDHPLLEPIAACRQCLVEIEMGGRPMPKPQPSCAIKVADGMVVKTQLTSEVAEKAQWANIEFILTNHPLDCPMCDKGGECPLQNQSLSHGTGESRFKEAKRTFVKPIAISTEILLDRDRCILCYRCTRFSEEIAGDPFIDMLGRGVRQQVGTGPEVTFQSYFSGNTIQICPVGALTSTAYRFRSRAFDLMSSPTICELCAAGCELRTDHRSGKILRRYAGENGEVNEEWNCDKGRFAFKYLTHEDRLRTPLVRGADGVLAPASWTDAMTAAAEGLAKAKSAGGVGVLAGGRLTVTDAYAYGKFARVALGTNDVDFRARVTPRRSSPSWPTASWASRRRPAASRTAPWRRPSTCCWSRWNRKRNAPSCSCACARRRARTAPRSPRSRRTAPTDCTRWAARSSRRHPVPKQPRSRRWPPMTTRRA